MISQSIHANVFLEKISIVKTSTKTGKVNGGQRRNERKSSITRVKRRESDRSRVSIKRRRGSIAHARDANLACDCDRHRVVAGSWNAVSANRCSVKKVRARVPLRCRSGCQSSEALSVWESSRWSDERTRQVSVPIALTLVFSALVRCSRIFLFIDYWYRYSV